MFLHPEILEPLAAATEAFAALRVISTEQVEGLFRGALENAAELWTIEPEKVDAYRRDQRQLREWLEDLAALDPNAPRLTNQTAQQLRQRIAPALKALYFATTVNFAERGGQLRLYPTKFGVLAACYLVIATGLEHESTLRVVRCEDCEAFVIQIGGRGKPRHHCPIHSAHRRKRRKDQS